MEKDITNQIIDYIDGTLSEDEKRTFEQLLESDKAIKSEYQKFLLTKDLLIESEKRKLKQKMSVWDKEIETEHKKGKIIAFNWKSSLSIAASIAFAIVGYKLLFLPYQFNSIYATNYQSYETYQTRSLIKNENCFEQGFSLFQEKKFKEASLVFDGCDSESLSKTNQYNLLFFNGLSKMETSNFSDTKIELQKLKEQILSNPNSKENMPYEEFKNEVHWYLGLCYVKLGERELAKIELSKIEMESKYFSKSQQLITELESILAL